MLWAERDKRHAVGDDGSEAVAFEFLLSHLMKLAGREQRRVLYTIYNGVGLVLKAVVTSPSLAGP